MKHGPWRTMRRRLDGDRGFGLAEAMVAAFILALFSTGIAGLITSSLKVSKIDRQRVAASSLAAREMEIVRDQFARSDDDALAVVAAGTVVNPNSLDGAGPSTVDGVAYTVTRSAAWTPAGGGASACDGGAAVSYPSVQLSVRVTWPDMRVAPVTSDSLVTPTKQLINTDHSFVAAKVVGYDGSSLPGRTVTSTGPSGSVSQVTDSSGCAVFGLSAGGAHTFSVAEAGYVDYYLNTTSSQTRTAVAGTVDQISFTYDRAVSMPVTLSTAPGHVLPSPLPAVVLGNSSMPSPGTRVYASTGLTTTATGLGPYATGYSAWAGHCPDANPAVAPTSKTVPTVLTTPGGSHPIAAELAPLAIQTTKANQTITAKHVSGCTHDLTLGTTSATGYLATSLPYGSWNLYAGTGKATAVVPSGSGITTVTM